jgi:hypothetical protein
VLERLAALPVTTWNYRANGSIRHMGVMAQDFYAAFGLGLDDRHISTVDAEGVALAAIQGLYQKVKALEAENAQLKAVLAEVVQTLRQDNEARQARMDALEARLVRLETAREQGR